MRKQLSVIAGICLMMTTGISFAQYPVAPNGSFETWTSQGNTDEEPTNWNSNKTGGGYATLGPQTCFRETASPYAGTVCVRMESKVYWGTVVNGSCTTGKVEAPSTNKAEGYVHTISGDPLYSYAFTGRPDSLIGYYKYTSVSSDYGKVGVKLHVGNCYDPEAPVNGNHPDATANVIARGQFFTPSSTVGSWTRFAIALTYVDNRVPEYILISMTSSGNQSGGADGSKMWVDGLAVVYNPKLNTGAIANSTYYVSATQSAPITVPFTLTGPMNAGNVVTAELSNSSGSFAAPVVLGTLNTTTSDTIFGTIPAGTANGPGYRVRVKSSDAPLIATDNGTDLAIIKVSNLITPDTTQHLDIYAMGAQLAISETPAGTSREWKYATTPGGPYVSFFPAETNATYDPLFPAPNTYYVICHSIINGLDAVSPEVQFIVTDPLTGIEDHSQNITSVYWASDNLIVNLQHSVFNNPRIQITDLSGRIIKEQTLESGATNTISTSVPAGIYMFRIFDNTNAITGKVFKK